MSELQQSKELLDVITQTWRFNSSLEGIVSPVLFVFAKFVCNALTENEEMRQNFKRNWPWTEAVIALNLRLVQGGLMNKWRDDFNRSFGLAFPNQLPYLIYEDDWSRDGPRPLGVADVLPHLQLLASCLCAAAVTFCAERWRAHSGAQRFAQMRMRRRGNAPLCEQLWRCKTDAHRPSKFMKLFSTKCTRK